jgi:formamidopyrimidine-DNA glycosylase
MIRIPHGERTQANDRLDVDERVERMANQLRANYECRHEHGWVYTRGGGECEQCGHFLPQYLFRCRGCHFMACNRCRRNRL